MAEQITRNTYSLNRMPWRRFGLRRGGACCTRRPPAALRPERRQARGSSLVRESTKAGSLLSKNEMIRSQYSQSAAVRQEGRGDIQKFLTNFRARSTPTGRGRTAPARWTGGADALAAAGE